jgi:hypothetical protein
LPTLRVGRKRAFLAVIENIKSNLPKSTVNSCFKKKVKPSSSFSAWARKDLKREKSTAKLLFLTLRLRRESGVMIISRSKT